MVWWLRRVLPCYQKLSLCNTYYIRVPSSLYSSHKKGKIAPLQERRMVDRSRLWAKGGEGGNGCFSYQRSRHDRRGRPDGGNGGRGGDVILECSSDIWDFSGLQHHLNAKRGGHGASKNMIGSRGADKVAHVPVGTVIHLVMGEAPLDVVDNSIVSLQPWDIPDNTESDTSLSSQQLDSTKEVDRGTLQKPNTHNLSSSTKRKKHTSRSGSNDPYMEDSESTLPSFHISNAKSEVYVDGEIERLDYDEEVSELEIEEAAKVKDKVIRGIGEGNEEEFDDEGEEEEEEEEEIQYSVAELTEPGQRLLIARGGEGGLGNIALQKSSRTHKHSLDSDDENTLSLTRGLPGSETVLILELKSIADVGLVGMPNAGKSTLLGAISRANPTVGHYAFTTLRPNIGNLNYNDFSITVADIPGLIKGAHENRGLGHAFLRHIERTKVLAYVVDLAAALDGRKGIPPWEQLRDLILELEHHRRGLSDRPSLVVANKIDEEDAEDVFEELKRRVHDVPIYPVCAVLEEGIAELKDGLRALMDGRELRRLNLDKIIIDS
ncbi:hypothetical protein QJS10_CPA03g01619 [Acorus calamus]|uniref:GTP-binding protein OBGM, mitochondrial n=1 Tax=Acorus calamus TaxID=4465 RepID=A0AAV9F6I3_ACOCL|nr:hypothetical protein QJS10_CPA03g01619 [Acorus calamus]